MTSATTPRHQTSEYTYTENGTLATATRPGGGVTTLAPAFADAPQYDANGRLVHKGVLTDARGVSHDITVNDRGRLVRDTFTADGVAYDVQAAYAPQLDSSDALQARRNDLYRVAYTTVNGVQLDDAVRWDPLGRVYDQTPAASPDATWKYTYDANGFLSLLDTATHVRYGIARDANSRLQQVFDDDRYTGPTGRATAFTWRTDGLVDTLTNHGITTAFAYDANGNPQTTSDTIGRATTMTHDAAGNVAVVDDGTTTLGYDYDASDRVVAVHDALGNTTTIGYQEAGCGCSQDGLVTSVHTPDLPGAQEWTFDYNADSLLSSTTDPLGNTESYFYTPARDLDSVTDRKARTTYFTYDQLGRASSVVDPALRVGTYAYPTPTGGTWNGPALYAGSPDSTPAPADLSRIPTRRRISSRPERYPHRWLPSRDRAVP